MNRRRHKTLAFFLAALLAFCGLLGAMECDCHCDDHGAVEQSCACDCVCCNIGGAAQIVDCQTGTVSPRAFAGFLQSHAAGDSGRLTESFIFTPPRT